LAVAISSTTFRQDSQEEAGNRLIGVRWGKKVRRAKSDITFLKERTSGKQAEKNPVQGEGIEPRVVWSTGKEGLSK